MKGMIWTSIFLCFTLLSMIDISVGEYTHHANITCPEECVCTTEYEVTCKGGYMPDVIRHLPHNVTSLTYYIDSINETAQKDMDFSNMTDLRDLHILQLSDVVYDTAWTREDLLNPLVNLEKLRINIRSFNPPAKFLLKLDNLRELDFSQATYFHMHDVTNLLRHGNVSAKASLKKLNFSMATNPWDAQHGGINLTEILPLLGDNPELHTVDFSNNGFVIMGPGLIRYLPNLKVLNLDHNLTPIPDAVQGCTALDMILHPNLTNLDFSRLSEDCSSITQDQPPADYNTLPIGPLFQLLLKVIKHTPIKDMSIGWAFNFFCADYVGDLTPNALFPDFRFLQQDDSCIMGLRLPLRPALTSVNIRGMPVAFTDFQGQERNKLCFSSDNRLEEIDVSCGRNNIADRRVSFTGLTSLATLRMRNSGFDNVMRNIDVFKDFPALESLNTGGTPIGRYLKSDKDGRIFRNLTHLTTLDLSYASLNRLHGNTFQGLKHLKTLNLSGNALSNVTFDIRNMTSLMTLDLSSNRITALSSDNRIALDKLGKRLSVNLGGNPLSCSCEDTGFVRWMQDTMVTLVNVKEYTCQHPRYGLVSVTSVDVKKLVNICNPLPWWVVLLVSVGGTCLIIGTVTLLWNKRYRLYYRFFIWRHTSDIKDPNRFSSDVFIVYADDDEDWVQGKLLDKLAEVGLKTSTTENILPGDSELDGSINLIMKSRKVLLILSPAFLRSKHCHYMMEIAQYRINKYGEERVELLWLEQPEMGNTTPTLMYLLDRKPWPHLCWPGRRGNHDNQDIQSNQDNQDTHGNKDNHGNQGNHGNQDDRGNQGNQGNQGAHEINENNGDQAYQNIHEAAEDRREAEVYFWKQLKHLLQGTKKKGTEEGEAHELGDLNNEERESEQASLLVN